MNGFGTFAPSGFSVVAEEPQDWLGTGCLSGGRPHSKGHCRSNLAERLCMHT